MYIVHLRRLAVCRCIAAAAVLLLWLYAYVRKQCGCCCISGIIFLRTAAVAAAPIQRVVYVATPAVRAVATNGSVCMFLVHRCFSGLSYIEQLHPLKVSYVAFTNSVCLL